MRVLVIIHVEFITIIIGPTNQCIIHKMNLFSHSLFGSAPKAGPEVAGEGLAPVVFLLVTSSPLSSESLSEARRERPFLACLSWVCSSTMTSSAPLVSPLLCCGWLLDEATALFSFWEQRDTEGSVISV